MHHSPHFEKAAQYQGNQHYSAMCMCIQHGAVTHRCGSQGSVAHMLAASASHRSKYHRDEIAMRCMVSSRAGVVLNAAPPAHSKYWGCAKSNHTKICNAYVCLAWRRRSQTWHITQFCSHVQAQQPYLINSIRVTLRCARVLRHHAATRRCGSQFNNNLMLQGLASRQDDQHHGDNATRMCT